ncbi:hypothetical protein OF83DRAFT_607452 [Amylostereum chailletii]|nr:hypothetical protein OF83DRAFT_607452 [Amylostereum chailletii]
MSGRGGWWYLIYVCPHGVRKNALSTPTSVLSSVSSFCTRERVRAPVVDRRARHLPRSALDGAHGSWWVFLSLVDVPRGFVCFLLHIIAGPTCATLIGSALPVWCLCTSETTITMVRRKMVTLFLVLRSRLKMTHLTTAKGQGGILSHRVGILRGALAGRTLLIKIAAESPAPLPLPLPLPLPPPLPRLLCHRSVNLHYALTTGILN